MTIEQVIEKSKLIVIVRKIYGDTLVRLAEAMQKGGVNMMEVTYDQADPTCLEKTAQTIEHLCITFGESMQFGAGTVLTSEQVIVARQAGSRYIVSPNTSGKVIALTKELGMVSIPGAMTPSEIMQAHECGANYVKIFPAGDLGIEYIKAVKAPITHVKLIATGGVNEQNFDNYLKAGYTGAGVSGRLTDRKVIEAGDFEELTRRARVLCDIAASQGVS